VSFRRTLVQRNLANVGYADAGFPATLEITDFISFGKSVLRLILL